MIRYLIRSTRAAYGRSRALRAVKDANTSRAGAGNFAVVGLRVLLETSQLEHGLTSAAGRLQKCA